MTPTFKEACCSMKRHGARGTGHVMCRSGKQLCCKSCEDLLEMAGEVVTKRGQSGQLQLWLDAANLEDEASAKAWEDAEAAKVAPKAATVEEKGAQMLLKGAAAADAAPPALAAKRARLPIEPSNPPTKAKAEVGAALEQGMIDEALIAAIVIGDPRETTAEWQDSAVCHLSNMNGMHVALSVYSKEEISKYLTYRFVRERQEATTAAGR